MYRFKILLVVVILQLTTGCVLQFTASKKHVEKTFNKNERNFSKNLTALDERETMLATLAPLLQKHRTANAEIIPRFKKESAQLDKEHAEIMRLVARAKGKMSDIKRLFGSDKEITSDSTKWSEYQGLKSALSETIDELEDTGDDYTERFDELIDALEDRGIKNVNRKKMTKSGNEAKKAINKSLNRSVKVFNKEYKRLAPRIESSPNKTKIEAKYKRVNEYIAQLRLLVKDAERNLRALMNRHKKQKNFWVVPGTPSHENLTRLMAFNTKGDRLSEQINEEVEAINTLMDD